MKRIETTTDWIIAKTIADELEVYAKLHDQKSNIQYSIYEKDGAYHIKTEKDDENILRAFLERMDE